MSAPAAGGGRQVRLRGAHPPCGQPFPDTQESAIYALLRGLGKEKYTEWYMAPGGAGPDRKYYRITSAGQTRLEEIRNQWRNMRDAIASFGVE